MKSSSLRLGWLQASRRGGSISDKQRLRCCGAPSLSAVPFEPLRNECLKKQGSGGICVQSFGKQGFVGNLGKELAPLLNYEAAAFTVVSPSHPLPYPSPHTHTPLNGHKGTKRPRVSATGQVKNVLRPICLSSRTFDKWGVYFLKTCWTSQHLFSC